LLNLLFRVRGISFHLNFVNAHFNTKKFMTPEANWNVVAVSFSTVLLSSVYSLINVLPIRLVHWDNLKV